jgi:feruloyl esterase
LSDGLIDDPRRCAFDPSTHLPKCGAASGETACYSEEQIEALAAVYRGAAVGGKPLVLGYPVGSEVFVQTPWGEVSGWQGWRIGGEKPFAVAITETVLRYMAFEQPEPEFDLFTFNFEEDPARMAWLRPLVSVTNPNLVGFGDRGGKLLMYYGWADQGVNPLEGIEYYESVMHEMGADVPDFFRLFMVPGMFHCGGGVGVDSIAWLTALVEWVEHATVPEHIIGTRTGVYPRVGPDAIGRTRPLCPYPQVARYIGEGSNDDAENFACKVAGTPEQ